MEAKVEYAKQLHGKIKKNKSARLLHEAIDFLLKEWIDAHTEPPTQEDELVR